MVKMGQLRAQLAEAEALAAGGEHARAAAQLADLVRQVIASVVEEDERQVHDFEAINHARRERQRVWSLWLDTTAPALQLELGEDREELAEQLAAAVRETPRNELGDRWKKHEQ